MLSEFLYDNANKFLPSLNNELPHKHGPSFKENFSNLNRLLLVMFSKDTYLWPPESAQFGSINSEGKLEKFNESHFYFKDELGLKKLHILDKVSLATIDQDHMDYTSKDILVYVMPFLFDKNYVPLEN